MATATTLPSSRRLGVPLRTLSDARLARLAAAGDREALAAIFERHHQPLYRYCRALLGSAEDAEDALQSAMARVVRALPGETRELALKPWLYRIAHNEAMRIVGRRRPQADLEAAAHVAARSDTEDREARVRLSELMADLGELSERQRGALVLRELEGASFAHIASVFGGSEAAAKQTVYEARVCLADFTRGRAMGCDEVTRALSDGDRRRLRGRPVRGHLRACEDCRAFEAALRRRPQELQALAPPLAAPAAAALLGKLLGGGGAGGLGAASTAGGALASISLPPLALKGLAAVAVVAGAAGGLGAVAPSVPGAIGGGEPPAISQGGAGTREGEEGERGVAERRREARDGQAGRAPDEREARAGASGGEPEPEEVRERLAPGAGAVVLSGGLLRGGPASGGEEGSRGDRPGASGRGGAARPGAAPAVDPPPRSAGPPSGPGRAPAPRTAPERTAPSLAPPGVPRVPTVPSSPEIGELTSPAAGAGTGRGSGP